MDAEEVEIVEILIEKTKVTATVIAETIVVASEVIEEDVAETPKLALEDVAAVYTLSADTVGTIEKIADAKVEAVQQVHAEAQQSNDIVEEVLIVDIIAAVEQGADLVGLIENAHLPFSVDVPYIEEPLAEKIEPAFNDYLGSLIEEFDAVTTAIEADEDE